MKWISMRDAPGGAGGQVWVAYRNPYHPNGWNLQVQWTPIISRHTHEPEYWMPLIYPDPPKEPV